jgi:glycosyltransferase
MMKISVVIPNYNDLRVKRTLQSIYSQTYKNLEVIVVDAVSTKDGICEIYDSFPIDKLIREKDGGIFDALNKGVNVATGELIYLMGSDDFLPIPDTFEKVVKEFIEAKDLDGVCLGCEFINSSGQVIRTWYPSKVTATRIKNGLFPPHFSLILKKELYELVGEFKYKAYKNIACDILWLLDLAIKRPAFNIKVVRDRFLVMEYGGASTGSFAAVWNQFKVVNSYVAQTRIPSWPYMSAVRTASKIFQFRFLNRKSHTAKY